MLVSRVFYLKPGDRLGMKGMRIDRTGEGGRLALKIDGVFNDRDVLITITPDKKANDSTRWTFDENDIAPGDRPRLMAIFNNRVRVPAICEIMDDFFTIELPHGRLPVASLKIQYLVFRAELSNSEWKFNPPGRWDFETHAFVVPTSAAGVGESAKGIHNWWPVWGTWTELTPVRMAMDPTPKPLRLLPSACRRRLDPVYGDKMTATIMSSLSLFRPKVANFGLKLVHAAFEDQKR